MPVFLLIRHAENDFVKKGRLAGRLPGVHLNERGRQQAARLAQTLAEAPISAIYSSPLERSMQTAAPLAEALGLPVLPRPGLMEVDFGDWENKTLKSLRRRKLWKIVQSAPSLMRFPSGETFAEAQLRIALDLQALSAEYTPQDLIACVSHGDAIKLAVAYFIGLPLDFFQRLHIAPASITALLLTENSSRLLTLNTSPDIHFQKPDK
jgi:probable phosphoglycerate mutase